MLIWARADWAGRPVGRTGLKRAWPHHMLFCSLVCGPKDKIKIAACPKLIGLLHSVKNSAFCNWAKKAPRPMDQGR